MAKQVEATVESGEEQAAGSSAGKRKNMILGGIFFGVMIVEALVVFVLVKSFVAPPPVAVEAANVPGLNAEEGQLALADAEVEVVKFRAQNEQSQRILIYDFEVYATVSGENKEKFQEIVTNKAATIKDHFTRIVRATDPQRFAEPDLATLRSQFKHELGQIAGDPEMILQVLIPSIVSYSED